MHVPIQVVLLTLLLWPSGDEPARPRTAPVIAVSPDSLAVMFNAATAGQITEESKRVSEEADRLIRVVFRQIKAAGVDGSRKTEVLFNTDLVHLDGLLLNGMLDTLRERGFTATGRSDGGAEHAGLYRTLHFEIGW